jgi:hypothetical protein
MNEYVLKLEKKPFADDFNSKGQPTPRFVVRNAKGKTPSNAFYNQGSKFFKKNYKISSYITLKRVGDY